jgi:Flp pilus assembly protein TadG
MRSSARRRGRGDSGAALVEFAIIMPLIFALFLGMFTGGISLSRKNSMTNAVREGARLGATLPEDSAWASSVQARVVALAAGDVTTAQVCVQLVRKDSASVETVRRSLLPSGCSAVVPPASTGVPVGQCVVKVWSTRTSEMQAVFFTRTLTLDAAAIGRYERKGIPETCST